MVGRWEWALLAASGCGRIAFDAHVDAGRDADPNQDAEIITGISCPTFTSFCDDFEGGSFVKWSYFDTQGGGMVNLTSNPVRAGTNAAYAVADPGPANGAQALVHRPGVQYTTGVLSVREWIRTPVQMVNFDLVIIMRDATSGQYLGVGGDNAGHWVVTEFDAANGITDHLSQEPTLPLDTWGCAEMVVTFPEAPNPAFVEVSVDGVIVVSGTLVDPAPSVTEITVGASRSDEAGYQVYIDDVAVARRRIGC